MYVLNNFIINRNKTIKFEKTLRKEPPYTVGGNVSCAITMENSMEAPRKLETELPYDPAIPVLGIYLDKIIIQKDTCTLMFIAAPFTIAKTWKQPKCP